MKTYWVHQDDPIDGLDDIPAIWEGKMIEVMKYADVQAVLREYAEAKQDFDDKRLQEDHHAWKERYNRLVKAEQVLIALGQARP